MKKYLILLFVGLSFLCYSKQIKDPYYESFYKITRLIMSSKEIKIYKHLPDEEKLDFINNFWNRRDPDPSTAENEALTEFKYRIAFVNKYFKEDVREGWNTDRGRILLLLGFPEEITKSIINNPENDIPNNSKYDMNHEYQNIIVGESEVETWVYKRYNLTLTFFNKFMMDKNFRLINPPPSIISAVEKAKFTFLSDNSTNFSFNFRSKYDKKKNGINIRIPMTSIQFTRLNGKILTLKFTFNVVVYLKYKKFWVLTGNYKLIGPEKDFLKMKEINFIIPYKLEQKGKYLFDVILNDLNNESGFARYRNFCKGKK